MNVLRLVMIFRFNGTYISNIWWQNWQKLKWHQTYWYRKCNNADCSIYMFQFWILSTKVTARRETHLVFLISIKRNRCVSTNVVRWIILNPVLSHLKIILIIYNHLFLLFYPAPINQLFGFGTVPFFILSILSHIY